MFLRINNNHEIINGCIANDRKSQEMLYQQFYHPMTALCFRYTKNQEDAIEVFHEALLKVYKNIGSYDESKSALFTWVHTIMVRTAIDFIRKKSGQPVNVEWSEAAEPVIQADILMDKSGSEIMALLKRLPEITATVFNLHVIEGYKHKEIAQLLNISEGTSKWHLSEAKKQLTDLLEKKVRA
jgi:RNA polymerase sigma factor (sigma-70 family)